MENVASKDQLLARVWPFVSGYRWRLVECNSGHVLTDAGAVGCGCANVALELPPSPGSEACNACAASSGCIGGRPQYARAKRLAASACRTESAQHASGLIVTQVNVSEVETWTRGPTACSQGSCTRMHNSHVSDIHEMLGFSIDRRGIIAC